MSIAPPRRAAASVYLSEACRQLQTYSSCKCRKSRPGTKCSPTCPCAECTLSSLPPLSGGFASQGPASAAGAFLWCRCSNTALRSFSWFLRAPAQPCTSTLHTAHWCAAGSTLRTKEAHEVLSAWTWTLKSNCLDLDFTRSPSPIRCRTLSWTWT